MLDHQAHPLAAAVLAASEASPVGLAALVAGLVLLAQEEPHRVIQAALALALAAPVQLGRPGQPEARGHRATP
jgi:hypothetical protein